MTTTSTYGTAREKTRPGPDVVPSWPILILIINFFILFYFQKVVVKYLIKNIYFILFNGGNGVPKSFTDFSKKRNQFSDFNPIPVVEYLTAASAVFTIHRYERLSAIRCTCVL